jgi:hypothetical protein
VLDPNEMDNGARDDCSIVALIGGQTEFDCSDVGNTIMDYYNVVDNNGNNGSCITNITIRDSVVSSFTVIDTFCVLPVFAVRSPVRIGFNI